MARPWPRLYVPTGACQRCGGAGRTARGTRGVPLAGQKYGRCKDVVARSFGDWTVYVQITCDACDGSGLAASPEPSLEAAYAAAADLDAPSYLQADGGGSTVMARPAAGLGLAALELLAEALRRARGRR